MPCYTIKSYCKYCSLKHNFKINFGTLYKQNSKELERSKQKITLRKEIHSDRQPSCSKIRDKHDLLTLQVKFRNITNLPTW